MGTIDVTNFKGIDVSVPEDQVTYNRATDALNMIPDAIGQVRKRPGIHLIDEEAPGDIVDLVEGHCVVTGFNFWTMNHSIFMVQKNGEGAKEYKELFSCIKKPLVVPYGKMVLIFAHQKDLKSGNGLNAGNLHQGKVNGEIYDALVAVLKDGKADIYTDDGIHYCFDGNIWIKAPTAYDDPLLTVPTMLHGCAPEGGGSPLEVLNILCPWTTESFCIKKEAGATTFHFNGTVCVDGLEGVGTQGAEVLSSLFKVEVLTIISELDSGGEKIGRLKWVERPFKDGDAYGIEHNRLWLNPANTEGDINKTEKGAIGPSPLEGEDNLRITYRHGDFKKNFNALCKATCATAYGIGGHKDRLFLGGVDDRRIYYSELEDPLYIGDLNYIEVETGAKIKAISGTGDGLAVLTQNGIYFVRGQVSQGEEGGFVTDVLFTIGSRIIAPEPITENNVAVLGGELVYLSKEGVVAITSKEHYSERYAEYRSSTINKKMMGDHPRFLVTFGRYLLIFCESGICWLLDENQPNSEGDKPYASHQYEGFRMDGFEASFAYTNSAGELILAKDEGFYRWMEGDDLADFKDESPEGDKAIVAYWETPWISGGKFYLRKTFRRLGILLQLIPNVDSAIKVEGKKNAEDWKLLMGYDGKFNVFHYDDIDYQRFTYATEPGCPDIKKKIRVKKATRFKLRFTNDIINQALVLNQFGLDYVQEG